MALDLSPRNPRTVYLGGGDGPGGRGGYVPIDDKVVDGANALPGMLVETFNDTGNVGKWRVHSTSAGRAAPAFLLDRPYHNQGIDDAYVDGELALVGHMHKGSIVYALVPSGANIVYGDWLESNGDGYLKEGNTQPIARAAQTIGAVTAATRIRAEVI